MNTHETPKPQLKDLSFVTRTDKGDIYKMTELGFGLPMFWWVRNGQVGEALSRAELVASGLYPKK
jgi:hypothetical protein